MKTKITVLGGQEQVGLNCTVIETEQDIIIIDLGNNFADGDFGVDAYIPNVDSLLPKKEKIRGLLITHGHYDHRGGIPYLIEKLGNPPIYGSPFTIELIREQLQEFNRRSVKFVPLEPRQEINLGQIHIQAVHITHSILGSYGYYLKTLGGSIFHTGDFKLDETPFREEPTDYETLEKIGKTGVDVAMVDSTRANRDGHSRSETSITENLEKLIAKSPGRIIVSTFAQMISRINQIALIGQKYGRSVFFEGRTIEHTTKIAERMGLMPKEIKAQSLEKIGRFPDEKILLFATGSQGEEMAAMNRMPEIDKGPLKVKPTDTIILSSSTIPGNLVNIQKLVDKYADVGCRVFTDDIIDIHAGGHAHRDEIRQMIEILKPKYVFPIEGFISFRQRQASLASGLGYRKNQIILVKNNQPVTLDREGVKIGEREKIRPEVIIGDRLVDNGGEVIVKRKLAAKNGLLIIGINKKNKRFHLIFWGVSVPLQQQIRELLARAKFNLNKPSEIKKEIKKIFRIKLEGERTPTLTVEYL